jgi:hypothetical protein
VLVQTEILSSHKVSLYAHLVQVLKHTSNLITQQRAATAECVMSFIALLLLCQLKK